MEDSKIEYRTLLDSDPVVTVQKKDSTLPQSRQTPPSPVLPPKPVCPSPVQPQREEHARQTRLTKREIVLITAVLIFAILSLIFGVLYFTTECSTTKKSNGRATHNTSSNTSSQVVENSTTKKSNKTATFICVRPSQNKTNNTSFNTSSKVDPIPKSCADWYKRGERSDGIFTIEPDLAGKFQVRCDMTTGGGGWTVFQRRIDGSVNFNRNWADYKNGFGNLSGEFWLGLDKIHRLTFSVQSVLRIDLEDFENETRYAMYSEFMVGSERVQYRLTVSGYSGDATDSLTRHDGRRFSTPDVDNDTWGKGNCAKHHKGGWWYFACADSNLNGVYHRGYHSSYNDGVNWDNWKGNYYSLKKADMKVRPIL